MSIVSSFVTNGTNKELANHHNFSVARLQNVYLSGISITLFCYRIDVMEGAKSQNIRCTKY